MKKSLDLSMRKKKIIMILFIMMAISSVMGAIFIKPIYVVKMDDKTIGFVEDKNTAEKALQNLKKDLQENLEKDIIFSQDIVVEKIYDPKIDKISTFDEIKKNMERHSRISIKAYELNVNGRNIAYLNSKREVNDILDTLKKKYHSEDERKKLKEIGFVENVKIQQRLVPVEKVQEKEEVLKYILRGKEKALTYILEEGDTVWDIMKKYDLTLEKIQKSNPDIDLEKVKIGQKLILMFPKPYINIKSIEVASYQEKIPFETQYKASVDMYQGDINVMKEGVEGEKKIYVQIERVNGAEQKKHILKEKTIKKPVMKVVERGTKERPKTMATGKLMTPARGRISSNFGSRWGTIHEGMDIAMPVGTDVKAADGGKVTFSGVQKGYGNLVIVDHQNGYETRYGHNSKLLVKAGDRVYKGQIIAKSGNTGRSTGPHLHFEVRENGVPVDPKGYVNYE